MKYFSEIALSMLLFFCLLSCQEEKGYVVQIKNDLDFARQEVIEIPREDIGQHISGENLDDVRLKPKDSDNYLRAQWLDADGDGVSEKLLVFVEVEANSEEQYDLVVDSTYSIQESNVKAYSRFVPERTDDYTWENDKVAFRTYGPTGEREALAGVPGSTLSSGIDLWLKRTSVSVIDKWYAEHLKEPGYYHKDHGEGYDPYHVGSSRGTGGSGIWKDGELLISNNYVNYKTIANGPLRTIFELHYGPWGEFGLQEVKTISLDLGSNFSKFDIQIQSENPIPNYAFGITLHENEGEYQMDQNNGWIAHWESIDDSFVGQGILTDPNQIIEVLPIQSEEKDKSNLLVTVEPSEHITYYAGFGWTKSGQISSKEDWLDMVEKQKMILDHPLLIEFQQSQ